MKHGGFWASLAVVGGLVLGGCDSVDVSTEGSVSEAGGFADPERRLAGVGEDGYCNAEVLRWRHDPATNVLRLADSRLLLSCCGQRAMRVQRIDRMVEVTEKDEPDASDRRCDSVCAFDFTVGIADIPHDRLYMKLLRDITDAQGSAALIWQGEIDLARSAGEILLNPIAAAADTCTDATQ